MDDSLVAPKPLVILFDEVDVLEGETMISFYVSYEAVFHHAAQENSPFPLF